MNRLLRLLLFMPACDWTGTVWTDDSRHIDVVCGGFWSGRMRFSADRVELSPDQLDALSGLRRFYATSDCQIDGGGCVLAITQGDGRIEYEQAMTGGGTCDQPRRLVEYATLTPFLETLRCRFSKHIGMSDVLEPDPRCGHGIFAPHGHNRVVLDLQVPSPGPRYLELFDCAQAERADRVWMQLVDQDAMTVLADDVRLDVPGTRGACRAIHYDFARGGSYRLAIETNDPLPAGDMFLRFE